jgi:hypothetical protein
LSSPHHSQINRLFRELADLRQADAREARKEAELLAKINRANEVALRTKSTSTMQSKLKESERASKELASVQKKRADISSKLAAKSKDLRTYEERQARDDEKARTKAAKEQRQLIRERQAHERRLRTDLSSRVKSVSALASQPAAVEEAYDFFISHASEDKEGFVRELARALRGRGARVWYDEFTLKVGDSLRRTIDRGLANSRFGVVVLSESFFQKEWPNRELDGLVALETSGSTRILPIWHKVSKDEVARYSAPLADKVALNTSLKTVTQIADELLGLLN